MAAYREGMKLVLIPKANMPDLYEVDDEVKEHLTFRPVSTLEEVLHVALASARKIAPRRRARKPLAAEPVAQTVQQPDAAAQPMPPAPAVPGNVALTQ